METIRIMCMELLHTDLYTGPATENDFIFRHWFFGIQGFGQYGPQNLTAQTRLLLVYSPVRN